jgi:hypothetical protein
VFLQNGQFTTALLFLYPTLPASTLPASSLHPRRTRSSDEPHSSDELDESDSADEPSRSSHSTVLAATTVDDVGDKLGMNPPKLWLTLN